MASVAAAPDPPARSHPHRRTVARPVAALVLIALAALLPFLLVACRR